MGHGWTRLRANILAAAMMGALLTSCGGGGEDNATGEPPIANSLSINVGEGFLGDGATRQLVATAHYSDGTTRDVTPGASWTSSDTGVATVGDAVGSKGRAAAGETGSTLISVQWNGFTSSARLYVGAALVRIDLFKNHNLGAVARGATIQYAAHAKYANNAIREITRWVTWSSSNPALAATSAARPGEFAGVAAGMVTVRAELDGVAAEQQLEVLPITQIYSGRTYPNGFAASIDYSGRIDAGQAMHVFTGSGIETRADVSMLSGTAESLLLHARVNAGVNDQRPKLLVMSSGGDAPVSIAAWTGVDGIFAAHRIGAGTWLPARAVEYRPGPFADPFGVGLRLAVDRHGNAMLCWIREGLWCSRRDAGTGEWSSAAEVSGATNLPGFIEMAGNASGQLVVAYAQRINPLIQDQLRVLTYEPGTGWSDPQAIVTPPVGLTVEFDIAINAGGQAAVVAALRLTAEATANRAIVAARYLPGSGWQPVEQLTNGSSQEQDIHPQVVLDDAGRATAVWARDYDSSIWARRFEPATGWGAATQLSGGNSGPFYGGSVYWTWAFATPDGRVNALWLTGGQFVSSRAYDPSTGWRDEKWLDRIGHRRIIFQAAFAFNAEGRGVAIWGEYYDVPLGDGITGSAQDVFVDATLSF